MRTPGPIAELCFYALSVKMEFCADMSATAKLYTLSREVACRVGARAASPRPLSERRDPIARVRGRDPFVLVRDILPLC